MVFVHSRKDTGKTGRFLITKMQNANDASHFECKDHPQYGFAVKDISKSRNKYEFASSFPEFYTRLARILHSLLFLSETLLIPKAQKLHIAWQCYFAVVCDGKLFIKSFFKGEFA